MARSILPALLLATAAVAQPGGNAEPLAAAHALEAAQAAGDRAALERLVAPDAIVVYGSGRIGGARDFVAAFARPGLHVATRSVGERLFLRPAADVAIVGGEARSDATEDGRSTSAHYRFAWTLARRADGWRLVYSQVTPLAP